MTEDKMESVHRISGLDCPDCANGLESSVARLPGVERARLVFATGRLYVTRAADDTDSAEALSERISVLVREMGCEVVGDETRGSNDSDRATSRLVDNVRAHPRESLTALAATLGVLSLALTWAGASIWVVRSLLVVAMVSAGVYVGRAAWRALRAGRRIDINALMLIAGIGAMAVGELLEGAVALTLFSLGELLETRASDRARRAIVGLLELAPDTAHRLVGDQEIDVRADDVVEGDLLSIRPGERIPVDATVVEGRSAVAQAAITGEPLPVEKAPGDGLYSGSVNGVGALVVRATHRASESTLARIMRLVEQAQATKSRSERFVDRFAQVYTPAVVVGALLLAVAPPLFGWGSFDEWVYRALILLVVSCPCALVLSTPVTVVSALARAARAGVLVKGGAYLEALGGVRSFAFDKTGTVTMGTPKVIAGGCDSDLGPDAVCPRCDDLVAKAAAVEERSEHALGRALLEHARARGLVGRYAPAKDVRALVGQGIEGMVSEHKVMVGSHAFCHRDGSQGSDLCEAIAEAERQGRTVLVIRDDCCDDRCYVTVADSLRPEAKEAITELRALGVRQIALLTGDNAFAARQIAGEVGIDVVHAGLLPEDKVDLVSAMDAERGGVAMVGDGVNDAPAMAQARVGIAMGVVGTDAAIESADMALMGDDLRLLPWAVRLSRRMLAIVRMNVVFALVTKALVLGLAAWGLSTLWMAVLADVGTSLIVSANGLRMLRFRRSGSQSRE